MHIFVGEFLKYLLLNFQGNSAEEVLKKGDLKVFVGVAFFWLKSDILFLFYLSSWHLSA